MGKIILEDFNEGNGYYKINLAYLNKEQVEEIESIVSKWNPTDKDIKSCIRICLTDADEQRFKDYGTNLKGCLDWLEKKVEQKTTDKVAPMFNVGDWLVNNNSGGVYRVTEIRDGEYCLWPIDAEIMGYLRIIDVDNYYHLWSIKDAKDGDVLATSAGAFIYNGNNGGGSCPGSYCGINTLGSFKTGVEHHWTGKKVYPATKEQRDLLFKKMHEAGYEWDAENKKLKKIEQKTTWTEEDDVMLEKLLRHFKWNTSYGFNKNECDDVIDWLKSFKAKNTLSLFVKQD